MQSHTLWVYVAASLALIATPGQDMIYVVTRSLAQGRFAGVCSAVGVCLGIIAHTALAALGVGAILQASEGLFVALKLLGAAYLVYLGLRMILSRDLPPELSGNAPPLSPVALVWQGMLSNLTNPKIVLFFFAFLPQFVDPTGAITLQLLAYGAAFTAICFVVYGALALLAAHARSHFAGSGSTWISRITGTVLLCLAARLIVTSPS
jgi:threonine/homoserine/homoserine lactone efflux protein